MPIHTKLPYSRFDYVYDYAGRLRSLTNFGSQPSYSQSFTYDVAGSMRSKTGIGAYVYPSAGSPRPHAPLTVNGASFAYDANGNMTTGLGGKAMTWDAENRVKTATLGGVTTTYVYGADGARLKRTVGGSTTLTVGPIEVRNYGTGSATLLLYPQPEVRLAGGQPAYLHRDQVGSIQLVTDGAGADGEHATYQPFGEARTVVAGTIPAETKGFVGERFDAAPEL